MSDLKSQVKAAGLAANSNTIKKGLEDSEGTDFKTVLETPFNLGHGTRRMQHQGQVILANLLNGQWMRVPEKSDQLLSGCLGEKPSEQVKDYCAKHGITETSAEDFLKYMLSTGIVEPGIGESEEDDIDILNPGDAVSFVEINETFRFVSATVCLDKGEKKLTPSLSIEQWVTALAKLQDGGVESIQFIADCDENPLQFEPLLIQSKQLFSHVTFHITGELRDLDFAKALKSYTDAVALHIDCLTEVEGEAEIRGRLEYQVALLQDADLSPVVRFPYHAFDIHKLPVIFDFCQELKVPVSFTTCSPTGNMEGYKALAQRESSEALDVWRTLIDRYLCTGNAPFFWDQSFMSRLKLSCGAGRLFITVSRDGRVYPCPDLMAKEFELGSVLVSRMSALESKAREILSGTNVEKHSDCQACHVAYFCAGGCLARKYRTQQPWQVKDPLCELIQDSSGTVPWKFDTSLSDRENLLRISDAQQGV